MKKEKNRDNNDSKGFRFWLPHYILQSILPKEKYTENEPIHIMICIVDHFEPFHGGADLRKAEAIMKSWKEYYPEIAEKYRDSDGRKLQHTWFYPPHHDIKYLKDLTDLCRRGYGEIEMHLHHNHMHPFPDTPDTLEQKIMKCIDDYSEYGIFCLPNGERRFAFVHGDWSLDNSRGSAYCGVNNEIEILKKCGCYADYTFPSLGKAQPAMINKIYYVNDNPEKPKSYNWGKEVVAGKISTGDLLMIPGIIGIRWNQSRKRLSIETSNIDESDILNKERIDYLVNNAVRIKGKPNWLFIKLHTHGAKNDKFIELFGKSIDFMCDYMDRHYNNKDRFFTHYVTAREMYNIVKAAEAGKTGNPREYIYFIIPRYNYLKG